MDRKTIYYFIWVVTAILLFGFFYALRSLRAWHWLSEEDNIVLLFLMGLGLTNYLTPVVFKLLGLSLDGKTTETLKRVEVEPFADRPIIEPFTAKRGGFQYIFAVCVTLLCLICIGPPLFKEPHTFEHLGHTTFHVLLFSVLVATAILCWLNIRKPLVEVNAGGIAYCDPLGVTSKYVAWRKLDSCDVMSERNVFGEVIRQSLVLRDTRGNKILTIWMESDSKETAVQHTEQITNLVKQGLTGVR